MLFLAHPLGDVAPDLDDLGHRTVVVEHRRGVDLLNAPLMVDTPREAVRGPLELARRQAAGRWTLRILAAGKRVPDHVTAVPAAEGLGIGTQAAGDRAIRGHHPEMAVQDHQTVIEAVKNTR
jgi:hypothetical protein